LLNNSAFLHASCCATIVVCLAGCGHPPPAAPRALDVKRNTADLRIQLADPLDLVRVERLDEAGRSVQTWTFTPGLRAELRLEPAPPAGRHRFRLVQADRRAHLLDVEIPEPPASGIRAKLELPLGVPESGREVWLPADVPATLSLLVERDSSEPLTVELRLALPASLTVDTSAGEPAWVERMEGPTRVLTRRMEARERRQFLLTVTPTEAGRPLTIEATVAAPDAPPVVVRTRVRAATVDDVRRLIQATEVRLPTDRFGEFDATRRGDTIQMPTRLGQWVRERLGGRSVPLGGGEPFAFQGVRLANRGETAAAVELRGWICTRGSRQPCLDFAPPVVLGKTAPFVSAPVLLPPRTETWVALPVYVHPATLPGDYRRDLEVRLLGSEAVLATLEAPLRVERTDRPAFFVALLAAFVTLLALPILAWHGPKLLGRFAAVELIQIALFGSAVFLLVGIPVRLLATLLNALLPVFSPFVLGLYGQVVAVAILGALVVLVPRPGVVLLAGLTRFLLNGVFFGAFSPVDFLYAIPMLLAGEICLWVAGVTRRPDAPPSAPALASACALMGVVAAGLQLSLEMSLFRLFFADWYVTLFLLLDGALYPALGAALGARLGMALRQTAE